MKTLLRLLFVFLFIALTQNLFAQIGKGSFRIGGSAAYSNSKSDSDNRYKQLSLRPSVAYFPLKYFSVGLTNTTTFASGDFANASYSSTDYSFGPELRYYFPFGRWAVFPEIVYSFGKSNSENTGFDFMGDPIVYKTESSYTAFRGGAGLTFFINPNIGIEGILSYQNSGQSALSPFTNSNDLKSINLNVGLQVYLNRK
jgi:outer membrane autotransporter protein